MTAAALESHENIVRLMLNLVANNFNAAITSAEVGEIEDEESHESIRTG